MGHCRYLLSRGLVVLVTGILPLFRPHHLVKGGRTLEKEPLSYRVRSKALLSLKVTE